MLRTAIRYSEYKGAGKLPGNISFDCAKCEAAIDPESGRKTLPDERNCGGYGNPKYKYAIGTTTHYQCPLSIPSQDAWDVVELILTQESTGIPISGKCLLDQTRKMFEFRRIIISERNDCQKEIGKILEQDAKKKTGSASSVGPRSRVSSSPRGRPAGSKQQVRTRK